MAQAESKLRASPPTPQRRITLQLRIAMPGEAGAVLAFYHDLIDRMQGMEYCPYWTKGVYPVLADIESGIAEGALYLADAGEGIAGAFILNHTPGAGYDRVHWATAADPRRVAVLHLLGVHPAHQGQGVGRLLLGKALEVARARGDSVIRLDTLTWNRPGRRLYEGFGFHYRGDCDQTYPTTGTIPFSMYELEVE